MPTKRSEKRERRKINEIRQIKNMIGITGPRSLGSPENPYTSDLDLAEDCILKIGALQKHYGNSWEFSPPVFQDMTDEEIKQAPWVETYRDLLLKKYGSLEIVEQRLRHTLDALYPD